MTLVSSSPATAQRRYAANIPRFYIHAFFQEFQLWLPVWVFYLQEARGLSLTQVTALDAPFWLVIVLAEVPTGAVADRWGRRPSLLLGALTFGVAMFLFGLASSYPLLLLSYLAWGLSLTLVSGADSAFLYDSLAALGREAEFRRIFGRAHAIGIGANILGVLAGAPLAAATSLNTPILLSAALALVWSLVVLSLREPPRHAGTEALPVPGDGPSLPISYLATIREAARYTLRHPVLRAIVALRAVLLSAGLLTFIFIQPTFASFGVPVARFGLLETPIRLAAVTGALVAHRLAVSLGERRLVAMLAAGIAAAYLLLGTVPSVAAVGFFGAVLFCNAAVRTLTGDVINRYSPATMRATLLSMAQMVFSVLLALTEPLLGLLADRTSLRTMFLVLALGVAVLGTITLAWWYAALANAEREVRKAE